LYESRIRELEEGLRDQRAALQESYNWTEAQTDASYRARDAAVANRFANDNLKPSLDNSSTGYNDLAYAATNAKLGIESVTIAEEAQRLMEEQSKLPDHLKTYKSYEQILKEVTARARYATPEQVRFENSLDEVAASLGLVVPGLTEVDEKTGELVKVTETSTGVVTSQATAMDGLATTYVNTAGAIDKATEALGRFANATPGDPGPGGLFPVQGPGGEYLASLDDSVRGQLSAIEANIAREFGTQAVDRILEQSLGGSADELANTLRAGTKFVNEATGRVVVGNVQGARAEQLIADGFTEVGKVSASVDDLSKAINDLSGDIAEGRIGDYNVALAKGGLVTGPTKALIGEAGPEVVIPLNKFGEMMDEGSGKTLVYNAAPNQTIDSEQALFQAMRRAKVVANW